MNVALTEDGRKRVTVIPGDGIGPEVVAAAMRVVEAAGAPVAWERCLAGAEVFRGGDPTGVPAETVRSIRETRVALKGPLETPVGFGEKSANVTLRKLFETHANIRPVREWEGVRTPFSGRGIDLVVVRENVEDLYAGIEHMQTPDVAQCLKIVTRLGCEKLVHTAFALARAQGRRKLTCVTKANIMKLTEGMLKRTFERIAAEHPDLEVETMLVDNCAHQLVRNPERFDVILTTNMNGDILSDLTSGLVGGLGFAPGANIGEEVAIFEAVHGTAPTIAGKGLANPTAVILSAAMLLDHLGEASAARSIEAAVRRTLAEGTLTGDVPGGSADTVRFTDRVIHHLERPVRAAAPRPPLRIPEVRPAGPRPTSRRTVGVDVFIEAAAHPERLGAALSAMTTDLPLRLKIVSNRGARVWPATGGTTACVEHWRCRFLLKDPGALGDETIHALLRRIERIWRWNHLEKLEELDGQPGWTRAQGEEADTLPAAAPPGLSPPPGSPAAPHLPPAVVAREGQAGPAGAPSAAPH